jgi:hypothetical protein
LGGSKLVNGLGSFSHDTPPTVKGYCHVWAVCQVRDNRRRTQAGNTYGRRLLPFCYPIRWDATEQAGTAAELRGRLRPENID